jgi:uncharacterized RDD family membrane protein YckC
MSWYYIEGSQKIGPITKADLFQLVKRKKVNARTPVWRPGMPKALELGHLVKRQPKKKTAAKTPVTKALPMAACAECKGSFAQDEMIRFKESWICAACKPVFFQKVKEGVPVSGSLAYAGFWLRFAAVFIDGLILGMLAMVVMLPLGFFMFNSMDNRAVFFAIYAIQMILQYAMPAIYESWFIGKHAATPGKMLCKLKVVLPDGGRVSYPRAIGRHFAKWISYFTLLIGFIMAAFDEQKRSLHDRICDTRVIQK